ncbi:MAG TPA: AraC family transcriptional regulator [Polyangiaceae bacterium]|nr:AraC family transcriptional regulator [Polyangiaceae bacterium]
MPFEIEHGVESGRYHYNGECVERARQQKKPVLGQFGGLADLFVPIVREQLTRAVLVVGPFATTRPTSVEVFERWRRITGRQGHPSDAEFAHYLSTTLSTLVMNETQIATFSDFLSHFAALLAGEGPPEKHVARMDVLRPELERARLDERVWTTARSMVSERTSRSWSSPHVAGDLKKLGLSHAPDRVVVGLLVNIERDPDPVDELLKRDAFQRACVELARSADSMISGQVGDHGVTFLSRTGGPSTTRHEKLLGLANKAATLARQRFGMRLHLGSSGLSKSAPLSDHYEAALAAAESALSQGLSVVREAEPRPRQGTALGKLRRELAALAEQDPKTLPARFDRYLESVALHCGYRLEAARAHVEAGFEDIAPALFESGALDPRSVTEAQNDLERAASEARTVSDLFSVYRRVVRDLSDAAIHPRTSEQDFRLRRALTHIQRHYQEQLTLQAVARVAGMTPDHFSRLFRRRERMTFAVHLRQLRIERSKQLLTNTNLEVNRIAKLCGFASQHYFNRTFQTVVGTAPLEWRKRRPSWFTKRTNR